MDARADGVAPVQRIGIVGLERRFQFGGCQRDEAGMVLRIGNGAGRIEFGQRDRCRRGSRSVDKGGRHRAPERIGIIAEGDDMFERAAVVSIDEVQPRATADRRNGCRIEKSDLQGRAFEAAERDMGDDVAGCAG